VISIHPYKINSTFIKRPLLKFIFEDCLCILKPKFLNFQVQKVNIGTEMLIPINLFYALLNTGRRTTLKNEECSKEIFCVRVFCVLSKFYFSIINMKNSSCQIYFIYISLWLCLDVLIQEQMNIKTTFNGKRYESMF